MELAAIQKSLALLYTNSQLRSRFFANPLEVRKELGLSEQNIVGLSTLSIEQVNLFATSLKRKRLGEVRELLPLTAQVLSREFNRLFWQYAETYMAEGIRKHQNDAIAFAAFIAKNAELAASDRPWLNDLVCYERAYLQVSETRVCFKVCIFSYRIDRLLQNIGSKSARQFYFEETLPGILAEIFTKRKTAAFDFLGILQSKKICSIEEVRIDLLSNSMNHQFYLRSSAFISIHLR